jgi:hypothetical protein
MSELLAEVDADLEWAMVRDYVQAHPERLRGDDELLETVGLKVQPRTWSTSPSPRSPAWSRPSAAKRAARRGGAGRRANFAAQARRTPR